MLHMVHLVIMVHVRGTPGTHGNVVVIMVHMLHMVHLVIMVHVRGTPGTHGNVVVIMVHMIHMGTHSTSRQLKF